MALTYADGVFTNLRNGAAEVCPVLTYAADQGTGAAQTIVAANTTKKKRIVAMIFCSAVTGGKSSFAFFSNATQISGSFLCAADDTRSIPFCVNGIFGEVAVNEALKISVSTNITGLTIRYVEYTP